MIYPVVARQNVDHCARRSQHSRDVGQCIRHVKYMFKRTAVENDVKTSGEVVGKILAVQVKNMCRPLLGADIDAFSAGKAKPLEEEIGRDEAARSAAPSVERRSDRLGKCAFSERGGLHPKSTNAPP